MQIRFNIEYHTKWGECLFLHYADLKEKMTPDGEGHWSIAIETSCLDDFSNYHYEVELHGRFERREWRHHSLENLNAEIKSGKKSHSEAIEINDFWQTIDRCAGTAIPVFSLRSRNSFGVGEFNDLKLMADWAAATGQKVLQLLPVNDTTMTGTWIDSYPYSANSIYALHPQFLNLTEAGVPADEDYIRLRDELNSLPAIDYERVNSEKDRLMRESFKATGRSVCATKKYKAFVAENSHWLLPYAAFRILTARFGTADFSKWEDWSKYDQSAVEDLLKKEKQECNYHCFIQYHLHCQLTEARNYAHSRGVYLKGDLPIGISPTSADAWASPELFHLDSQAGAPPDAFATKGQNWGLPTYNWERMEKDGYAWWKSRMKNMEEYFDLFRIDHILGFFRIWEIPKGASSGLLGHFSPALPYSADYLRDLGFTIPEWQPVPESENVLFIADPRTKDYWHPRIAAHDTEAYKVMDDWHKNEYNRLYDDFFYHRHNGFWKESAMKKLPGLLAGTEMLACGEDLGMIPDCVPEVMRDLFILSLEIQRMPKSSSDTFADVWRYPYMSVCSTSTHDMTPLRAWWKENRDMTNRFYHEVLQENGDAPENCSGRICHKIVKMHTDSPSVLAILPLQDWMSIDEGLRNPDPDSERINDPAVSPHYWRYRMHITLEELLSSSDFNSEVLRLLKESGRA